MLESGVPHVLRAGAIKAGIAAGLLSDIDQGRRWKVNQVMREGLVCLLSRDFETVLPDVLEKELVSSEC